MIHLIQGYKEILPHFFLTKKGRDQGSGIRKSLLVKVRGSRSSRKKRGKDGPPGFYGCAIRLNLREATPARNPALGFRPLFA
jgi:hypothetical protein